MECKYKELKSSIEIEDKYAYNFEGKRYDVGDKFGYLQATLEYALRKPENKKEFIEYINNIVLG